MRGLFVAVSVAVGGSAQSCLVSGGEVVSEPLPGQAKSERAGKSVSIGIWGIHRNCPGIPIATPRHHVPFARAEFHNAPRCELFGIVVQAVGSHRGRAGMNATTYAAAVPMVQWRALTS
jgi:hypothetical protein